jgi:cytochrome c biogenesis protein CcmG, thiol:disulfide interchange protein DsbE
MRSDHRSLPLQSRRRFVSGAGAALLAPLSGYALRAQANELKLGLPAPSATLVTLEGKTIATTALRGQVVILTFWATCCTPCREELPLLSRYAAQHASAGLTVLGFSLDTPDRMSEVQAVARSLSFPVGLLADSNAPGYGRIWRLPVNFTIDRSGRLIDDGWKDKPPYWTQARLDEIVTPLLGS